MPELWQVVCVCSSLEYSGEAGSTVALVAPRGPDLVTSPLTCLPPAPLISFRRRATATLRTAAPPPTW